MKTKEEIELLAEKAYPIQEDEYRDLWSENRAYQQGYTQALEDNKEKKYTEEDIINALHSVELKNNKNYSKIYEDMKEYLHSLNKQD
jgi:hypothetical protein